MRGHGREEGEGRLGLKGECMRSALYFLCGFLTCKLVSAVVSVLGGGTGMGRGV